MAINRGRAVTIHQLVAEVADRPHDIEVVRVFADWLLQQGHPLGELAVVQLERMRHDSAALAQREAELIANTANPFVEQLLGRANIGTLAVGLGWRGGLLDVIGLQQPGEGPLADVLARLASDPVLRLVRRIEIEAIEFDGEGDLEPALRTLAALALPRLCELVVREGADLGNPWVDGPIRIGDVTPLYAAYPRLAVLELDGKAYELGDLALPSLRRFALGDVRPADIVTVARGKLPALEELELFFGPWRVDGIDAVFRQLFDREMPRLGVVRIGAEAQLVAQYLVRALPGSQLARHARVLAFPRSPLDDDCVRTLVQWAPRLRALERLELEGQRLTPESVRLLHATFGPVLVLR